MQRHVLGDRQLTTHPMVAWAKGEGGGGGGLSSRSMLCYELLSFFFIFLVSCPSSPVQPPAYQDHT